MEKKTWRKKHGAMKYSNKDIGPEWLSLEKLIVDSTQSA